MANSHLLLLLVLFSSLTTALSDKQENGYSHCKGQTFDYGGFVGHSFSMEKFSWCGKVVHLPSSRVSTPETLQLLFYCSRV